MTIDSIDFGVFKYHKSNNMLKHQGLLSMYMTFLATNSPSKLPKVILGQREELKALVIAGESFERAAQAGEGHVAGNS